MRLHLCLFYCLYWSLFIALLAQKVTLMFFTTSLKLNFRIDLILLKGRAGIAKHCNLAAATNKFWLNLGFSQWKRKSGMAACEVKENNEVLSSAHGNDSLVIVAKNPLRKMKPDL